jgi:small subunit ribosomal protein S2
MSEEVKGIETQVETKDVMETTVHHDGDAVVAPSTLLAAGVHFGHRVSRWNPQMKQYIFGKRNNLHIIDLNKSAKKMQEAYVALKDIVAKGGKVLFVGTKGYAQQAIKDNATRSGSFYVNHRWLGGTLTNFKTILKRIDLLKTIEAKETNGELEKLTKKEQAEQLKLKAKLLSNLEGIKEIRFLPQAIVVVDPKEEHNAIHEARALHIPVFALGDTNTNPDEIDYLVPANDDAESSISIIVGLFGDAVVEGKGGEPLYAYKSTDAATKTMDEMMKGVDQAEQLKAIRQKLRDDAIALRKAKNAGRPHRKVAKVNKFKGNGQGRKPMNKDAKPAEKANEAAAPAEAPKATEEAK